MTTHIEYNRAAFDRSSRMKMIDSAAAAAIAANDRQFNQAATFGPVLVSVMAVAAIFAWVLL